LTSFHDFGLAEPITRALAEEKYATPTPIQAQTIPVVMSRRDVIGIAPRRCARCKAASTCSSPRPGACSTW
jgi:hypothetical protein